MKLNGIVRVLIIEHNTVIANHLCEQIDESFPNATKIHIATTRSEAVDVIEKEKQLDILIGSLEIPKTNMLNFLANVSSNHPSIHVVILTKNTDLETVLNSFAEGRVDYVIPKPWTVGHVRMGLTVLFNQILAERETKSIRDDYNNSFYEQLNTLTDIIAEKSPMLHDHAQRVGGLAIKIAEELSLNDKEKYDLELAASLYVIGLIGYPSQIYTTHPKQLSGVLRKAHQQYHEASAGMLKSTSALKRACVVILAHRENLDGTGPLGLAGESIPVEAQILRVCDHYQSAIGLRNEDVRTTIIHMNRHAGERFSKNCLRALIKTLTVEIGDVVVPVRIDELEEGMKIARKVFSQSGRMVVSEKTVITKTNLRRLKLYHLLDPIKEFFVVSEKD